ncbi:nitrate- and nitrite sensing domain-containing protein [Nocardiopsis alborubida]|uniref:nitrate- and nitrite sensing domain-containing protein n=1 Tax=Nocardiopsis alborubida TaxID=146802 RepID=UPI00076E3275|nr:nitrate- and nitrite sensing domain-containing protein [Nocardiopsis alborubida]
MRRTRDNAPTIRRQLTRIVLIPSLCFLALWLVVAAVGTIRAVQFMGAVVQAGEGAQVFSEAAEEVCAERRLSLVHLGRIESTGTRDDEVGAALDEQRENTDAAMAEAVAFAERLRGTRDDEVKRSATALVDSAGILDEVRADVDGHGVGQAETILRYGEVLAGTTGATTALVHTTDGGENLTDAVLTSELMGASSAYSTADALLAGAIARGEMSYEETAHFTYLTATYRDTLESVDAAMHPSVAAHHEEVVSLPAWSRAEDLSRQVVTRRPLAEPAEPGEGAAGSNWNADVDIRADAWDESSAEAALALQELAGVQARRTIDLAWSAALVRVSSGVAAAALTLAGGAVAIAVVGRSSRRLTERLTHLREQILDRDGDLPGIVDRAQRGEKVDVQEELPPLDEWGDDEIGQVAEAFDAAQLTAVESAVLQAEIRRGANRAFLGIAFRNQALVQRQLRLLDEIEYHEQDPEALRRLFRLDHLATRARRYSDNLIILGGGQSARRWRQPRPLVDVLRAAIAETEDFERVRLTSAPRVLVHGQVVADVVHLLAELVENATQFSPAGTPVDVGCTPAAEGLVVEVEDRGLGMSERGYAEAERTLTQSPEFDVMALPEDPRLGLFVVSRLAGRHGVRVWLRPSPYGGTRATVLIPASLLEPVDNLVTVSGTPTGRPVANGREPGVPTGWGASPVRAAIPLRGHTAGGADGTVQDRTGPQVPVVPSGQSGPQSFAPQSDRTGPQVPVPPLGQSGPQSFAPQSDRTGPQVSARGGQTGPRSPVGRAGQSDPQVPVPPLGQSGPQSFAPQSDRTGPQVPVVPSGQSGPQSFAPQSDRTGPHGVVLAHTGPQGHVPSSGGPGATPPGNTGEHLLPHPHGRPLGQEPVPEPWPDGAARAPAPTRPRGNGES